jgi:dolichyl-phosphate-mannose-protein mannosyltransferase
VWGAGARSRIYNSTGFFFLAWLFHYIPFFLMGRQLFLHHYLPAHLASALVAGAVMEFVFNVEPLGLEETTSSGRKKTLALTGRRSLPPKQRMGSQSYLAMWAATGVILAIVIGGWYFFLPLTYGYPGLSVPEVNARKWLAYDLHFAK